MEEFYWWGTLAIKVYIGLTIAGLIGFAVLIYRSEKK